MEIDRRVKVEVMDGGRSRSSGVFDRLMELGASIFDWIHGASIFDRLLFKFTGKDDEINLLGDGTEKAKFGAWSWMSPEQVVDHAVDFKKPVYREVLTAFSPHLQ